MAVSLSIKITQNSQSVANNTSNITVELTATSTYGSYNKNQCPGTLTIDGVEYSFTSSFNTSASTSTVSTLIFEKTVDITHSSDGSKKVEVSAYFETGVSSGNISATASKTLTTIPRKATLDSAPNFDDEDNPEITYTNSAGSGATTLQACIASSDGKTIYVAYRNISKTATSYTFNLTTAERNALRNAIPNDSSMTVKFYVKTVIADSTYYSTSTKTFSIVNANPTISPTITDTNTTTTALTGDSSKLVRYFSDVSITTGASAIKGATLKSQKVVNGSKSITTATGTIEDIENGVFTFTANDSRGNSTTHKVEKDIVNYVKLTLNIANKTPDATGNFTFTVNGNYFNGSFGAKSNSLTVKYRYCVKGDEGNYSAWANMNVIPGYGTYSATAELSGLDYQTTYTFQAKANDALISLEKERAIKASPVFDWSEDDFNFNVPVSYTDGGTKYYFSQIGKALMTNTGLTCEVVPGDNYSSATGSVYLIGNVARVYFNATRSEAISPGNITDELICSFTVNTGGRIIGLYTVYGICSQNNSAFYVSNSSVSGDTLTFDIKLACVGLESKTFSSYTTVPARIDLSKF